MKAYQLLLFDDDPITSEKKMWVALCNLEESQDRLRRALFREVTELKKENKNLTRNLRLLRLEQDQSQMLYNLDVGGK